MFTVKLNLHHAAFRLVLLISFYVSYCKSVPAENTWIAHPESLQYNLPIFPSRIPFGSSTFSTSTAVMISFAKHQCLATATATGVCRRRSTESIADESSILEKSNGTPLQLEPSAVLSEMMSAWPKTTVPAIVSSEAVSETAIMSSPSAFVRDSRFVQKLMTSTALPADNLF